MTIREWIGFPIRATFVVIVTPLIVVFQVFEIILTPNEKSAVDWEVIALWILHGSNNECLS